MTPAESTPAVIYCRVSTREQGDSGLGLESQEDRCREECVRRGWVVAEVIHEVVSGAKSRRPLFATAQERACEMHGVLVVVALDRLGRKGPMTVLPLYEQATREGWAIYSLDFPEVNTTDPMGEFMLTIWSGVARLEREMAKRRTRAAMKRKADRGEPVGRPRELPQAVELRMRSMLKAGASLQKIADTLNDEELAPRMGPRGESDDRTRRWHKQGVHQTVRRYQLA